MISLTNFYKLVRLLFKKRHMLDCQKKVNFVQNWLTLKRLGGGGGERERGGETDPPPPVIFLKNVSFKERLKSWCFVTFNIILRHILPENFIEFPQVIQKI